jgi:hypothetical protein
MLLSRLCLAALLALLGPATAGAQTMFKCLDGNSVTYSNTTCEKLGLKAVGEVPDRVTTLPTGAPFATTKGPAAQKPQPGVAPANTVDMPKAATIKPVNPLIEKLAK